jgi:hypothetical protein
VPFTTVFVFIMNGCVDFYSCCLVHENTNLCPLFKLYNAVCCAKMSKTCTVFIVSGNSFNVNQFRRSCVGFFVLIVNIWKKIVIDTERKREQPIKFSRQLCTS